MAGAFEVFDKDSGARAPGEAAERMEGEVKATVSSKDGGNGCDGGALGGVCPNSYCAAAGVNAQRAKQCL